jgi:hypothetical protein
MGYNKSKFSWVEAFSNGNGKTSATAICGVTICFAGTFCFVLGCIDRMFFTSSIDIVTQSILFVGIGAGLLGVRKVVDSKGSSQNSSDSEEESSELIKG